jgi:signal transduction histidine kinase
MSEDFYEKLWQTIKIDKKVFVGELKNKRKNGEEYDALASISPVLDDNDNVLFFVSIERDISKEKELDRIKDEFVSIASHELRTPLTAIDGIVSMMRDGEYGEINKEIRKGLDDVNTASERLITLVNDLLSLSRIQAGRLKYELSEFGVEKPIKDVCDLFSVIVKKKGLELKTESGGEIVAQADMGKFKQILNNLLNNALKFTDSGYISVSFKEEGDNVNISIQDTGCGISKKDMDKLFGKFQQASNQSGRPPGTGLGLHLSREMTRKMGGDLWIAESEVGRGSTFVISLPKKGTKRADQVSKNIADEARKQPDQKSDRMEKV